jgi:hypothetical protein
MAEFEVPENGLGTTTAIAILDPAAGSVLLPAMVAAAGERAARRFIDFFTANIRNPNTRAAYDVAVRGFFAWLDRHGILELGAIRTHHVSTYIETLMRAYRALRVVVLDVHVEGGRDAGEAIYKESDQRPVAQPDDRRHVDAVDELLGLVAVEERGRSAQRRPLPSSVPLAAEDGSS